MCCLKKTYTNIFLSVNDLVDWTRFPFWSLKFAFLTECVKDCDRTLVNKVRLLFLRHFWPFLKQAVFFEVAGAVVKIVSILKPNHHNQVNLVQIRDSNNKILTRVASLRNSPSRDYRPNVYSRDKEVVNLILRNILRPTAKEKDSWELFSYVQLLLTPCCLRIISVLQFYIN